ncbi:uncharacterized protein SPSK_09970 [Sporothrix schenckii 1099-18]|uniref:Uncharacterized protein n=1 Tax=Sporothrix schenckii 1099-18 TaxID=1397361 RepID=A0A0F2M6Y3_SPOSC|nr:uncharacterized protein SPSK_09970 [Sporothrix schenckii 1099-18]KJR85402.1 hypothetical protein SPSK_09970 [Sporothrix schenckii 1099-18]
MPRTKFEHRLGQYLQSGERSTRKGKSGKAVDLEANGDHLQARGGGAELRGVMHGGSKGSRGRRIAETEVQGRMRLVGGLFEGGRGVETKYKEELTNTNVKKATWGSEDNRISVGKSPSHAWPAPPLRARNEAARNAPSGFDAIRWHRSFPLQH